MSLSGLRPYLRNALLVVASAGVIAMAWVSLVQILRASPFAKFGLTGKPVGAEVGVTLSDYEMKAYEKDRLVAEMEAEKVEVRRDRSMMELKEIKGGKFYPKDEDVRPLSFDMDDATYFYFQDRLMANKGAHVKNEDLDLESDQFVYEKASQTLLVRGNVQGKLSGGQVKGANLALNTGSKALSAQNVVWVGKIDELAQDAQRQEWRLGPGNMELSPDGKTQTWKPGRATDGEVIVVADTVVYTKETDVLVAKGNVKYFGVDANMLCDEATVYRKEKRAVFTGVVRMVVKSEDDEKVVEGEFPTIERVTPESVKTNPQGATERQVEVLRDSDNMRKYPIKILANKVEYWYKKGERRAVITGSPFARQDLPEGWRLAWAPEAFYDGEKETLTMKGPADPKQVKLFMSIGDQYVSRTFTLSTKEGDKSMSASDAEAVMFTGDEDVPTRTGGGNSAGSGGGATTGGGTSGGATTGG